MSTIKIKIHIADKRILLKLIESIEKTETIENLNEMIVFEIVENIRRKLSNSLQNEKFTLELTEIELFCILLKEYETIGVYESVNAILLSEQIGKKVREKINQFIIHN